MSALKLSDAIKEVRDYFSTDISNLIEKFFTEKRFVNYLTSKSTIRISNIPYLCPRKEAIMARDKLSFEEIVDHETSTIFEFGHAFEDIVRHRAFGPSGMLVGMWECENCGYVHGALDGDVENGLEKRVPMPSVCNINIDGYGVCGGKVFKFREEKVSHGMYQIQGHPDGVLANSKYDHVLELKTANDHRFKMALRSPFPEHIEQASMYAFLMNKKRILLYYFNKNNGKSAYYDLSVDGDVVTKMCNKLRITWIAIRAIERGESFEMPERTCKTIDEQRAKKCQVCSKCFLES